MWFWNLVTALPELIKGGFGLASKGLDYYIKRADGDVQKAVELMKLDQVRINAQRDVQLAAMNHPIFWVAWIVWVIPPGFHHAAVFFVSTFDAWLNVPGCYIPEIGEALRAKGNVCNWYVRKVPSAEQQISTLAAGAILGIQVGTGIVASILNRVVKR